MTGAVVAGSTVTLTLSAAVRASDTVAVGYTVGTNPIRLSGGQQAESFADVSAVNSTPLSADAMLGGLVVVGHGAGACFCCRRAGLCGDGAQHDGRGDGDSVSGGRLRDGGHGARGRSTRSLTAMWCRCRWERTPSP